MSYTLNEKRSIENIVKKLADSNIISEETTRSLKAVGIMYVLCKNHKDMGDNCLLFQPTLSTIKTPNYKLEKFLETI